MFNSHIKYYKVILNFWRVIRSFWHWVYIALFFQSWENHLASYCVLAW